MNRHLLILLSLLVAVTLVACAGEVNLLDDTKLQDYGLVDGEPCEAPCWNNITPGETSYRDAKLIIESDQRFKIAEEPDPEEGSLARIFSFSQGENQACCQVFSRDGETISSFLLQMAPVVTFGPVYDRHGEPRYVGAEQVSEEQAYMALVYPDTPMVVYAFVAGPQSDLAASSEIIGVMQMAETEMAELLNCTSLHDWGGFQSFANYADSEFDYVGEGVGDEEQCPTG